jgi:hypothetical protein
VVIKYLFSIQNEQNANKYNFRESPRFETDVKNEDLEEHIQTCSKNKLEYTGGILSTCNDLVLQKIVFRVSRAKCFAVFADATTSISTTDQFSLCVPMWVELK